MIEFFYTDPAGESHADPTPDALTRVLLEEDEEYWGGSGSAMLGWFDVGARGVTPCWDRPCLHFFRCGAAGFHFAYDTPGGERLVTYDWSPLTPRVHHVLGGTDFFVPRACLVSREQACRVVGDFLNDARPSNAVSWVDRDSLDFDETEGPED